VRFLGYQEQVASLVAAADVHLSTSDTEGIPAVVIESGYLGVPTVAFRVGGMHECIRDGETGMLVPAGDEDQFVGAVLSLLDSASVRREMGKAARRWISTRFSIGVVGQQYEAFYSELLGRRAA
jgi:glycosyltransferase involved in cell wall biosynthesis